VSYLGSGCEDLDAAVVADVGGGVQQLLEVVDHAVQLLVRGHHAVTAPADQQHADEHLEASDASEPLVFM